MPVATPRVLVADDQPLTRWAVARAVEALGMCAVQATTREETCGLLLGGRFQAVVIASQMLECDMTDVLAELDRYQPATCLVVLCDGDSTGLRTRLARAVIFEKPFSLNELATAVASVGAGRPT